MATQINNDSGMQTMPQSEIEGDTSIAIIRSNVNENDEETEHFQAEPSRVEQREGSSGLHEGLGLEASSFEGAADQRNKDEDVPRDETRDSFPLYHTENYQEAVDSNRCQKTSDHFILDVQYSDKELPVEQHSELFFESCFLSCVSHSNELYATSHAFPNALYKCSAGGQWTCVKCRADEDVIMFTLALFNGQILRVGGRNASDGKDSKAVRCLKKMDDGAKWVCLDDLKAMEIGRCYPSVASNDLYLAVCGGVRSDKKALNDVEIYDGQKKSWDKVCGLPFFGNRMSVVVNGECLYVSNAYDDWQKRSESQEKPQLACASIKELIEHKQCCRNNTDEDQARRNTEKCWKSMSVEQPQLNVHVGLKNPPLILFKLQSRLLAISGRLLYSYFCCDNTFKLIGKLETSNDLIRYGPSIVINSNKILMIGGQSNEGEDCKEVKQLIVNTKPC